MSLLFPYAPLITSLTELSHRSVGHSLGQKYLAGTPHCVNALVEKLAPSSFFPTTGKKKQSSCGVMSKENLGGFHGTTQQLRLCAVVRSADMSLSFSGRHDLQPPGEGVSQGF